MNEQILMKSVIQARRIEKGKVGLLRESWLNRVAQIGEEKGNTMSNMIEWRKWVVHIRS